MKLIALSLLIGTCTTASAETITERSYHAATLSAAETAFAEFCPEEHARLSESQLWESQGFPGEKVSYWQIGALNVENNTSFGDDPKPVTEELREFMDAPSFGDAMAYVHISAALTGSLIAVLAKVYDAEPLAEDDWAGTVILYDAYRCVRENPAIEQNPALEVARDLLDDCLAPSLENVVKRFDEAELTGTADMSQEERVELKHALAETDPLFPGTPASKACEERQAQ